MRRRKRYACLVLCLGLWTGCQSNPKVESAEESPYEPPGEQELDSIGYFLAQYDISLRHWMNFKLGSMDERERRKLRALEQDLSRRAVERQDELIAVVESGSPTNRQVASVALGFTGDPAVLSTLLSALSDPEPEVVQKALLGVGILGDPKTPLTQINYLMVNHYDSWTRNNAAFAVQRIVMAGGGAEDVVESCREGLYDEEPGVRAQCASVLGWVHDTEATQLLGDALYDEVNLVASAAARSLGRIGAFDLEQKGKIARLMVDAVVKVGEPNRSILFSELAQLAGHNYGEEIEPWREWAYKLP